jgi:hypothetical protein
MSRVVQGGIYFYFFQIRWGKNIFFPNKSQNYVAFLGRTFCPKFEPVLVGKMKK